MKIIGVAGYARSGKDTFVGIAKNILNVNGYNAIRIAFADNLKEEITEMLLKHGFNANVYTNDDELKTLIRPLLVWWGCQRRYESHEGLYWVEQAEEKIKQLEEANKTGKENVYLVSDVRFVNECKWVQEMGGEVIHIRRWKYDECKEGHSPQKVFDIAPNSEEANNDPLVQEIADLRIDWESKEISSQESALDNNELHEVVFNALKELNLLNGKDDSSAIAD